MKKFFLLFALCATSLFPTSRVHAAYGLFGTNGSFIILSLNGAANTYYHMTPGVNAAFEGAILGAYNPGSGIPWFSMAEKCRPSKTVVIV
jgi:hypothetical protein